MYIDNPGRSPVYSIHYPRSALGGDGAAVALQLLHINRLMEHSLHLPVTAGSSEDEADGALPLLLLPGFGSVLLRVCVGAN